MRLVNTEMVFKSSAKNTVLAYRQNGVAGQCFGMSEEAPTPLARARADKGLTRPKLATLAGTSPQQIERLEKGMREMTRIWADRLAPHLGVSPEFLVFSTERKINVVGYAAAGGDAVTFYGEGQGPFDEVDAPAWATEKTVAVRVRGTSLGKPFNNWIAFYDDRKDPPDESLYGELCICELPSGRVLIKTLRKGTAKGLYNLESVTEPTLEDQQVLWAALVRELRRR